MTEISESATHGEATDRVISLFRLAASTEPPFPPTEMYSEGWMLRLVMDAHNRGAGGLPFNKSPGARWYSEARLMSPFQPAYRGDPRGEGQTHADGVIGHIDFRPETSAGLRLNKTASQFIVVEAKMGSKLAAGTSRVSWYDQAARNVAAMAWTIWISGVELGQLESLAFLVTAPEDRIAQEGSFRHYMDRGSVAEKVRRRIALYEVDDPTRHHQLAEFYSKVFEPFIERTAIDMLSWEQVLEAIDPPARQELYSFYKLCRTHNGLLG